MPLLSSPAAPTAPRHLLGDGWYACPADVRVPSDPELGTSRVIARRPGIRVVLVEAPVGSSLAGYPQRLHYLRRARRWFRGDRCLCVFTDPAHSTFVWSWRETSPLGTRHVEYRTPARSVALRRELRRLASARAGRPAPPAELDPVQGALVDRLRERLPAPRGSVATPIVEVVTALDAVSQLRRFWSALLSLRILHRGCGRGSWLLCTARLLEPLYLAGLDRMRAWIDEAAHLDRGRRPEHLKDLRAQVAAAEESRALDPVLYVRRLILQRNLFGLAETPAAHRAARRALLRYCGSRRPGLAVLDMNLGCLDEPYRARDAVGQPPPPPGWVVPGSTSEELEMLAWTRDALREHRLLGERPAFQLNVAAVELHRRRLRLLASLSEASAAGERSSGPTREDAVFLRSPPGSFDIVHSG